MINFRYRFLLRSLLFISELLFVICRRCLNFICLRAKLIMVRAVNFRKILLYDVEGKQSAKQETARVESKYSTGCFISPVLQVAGDNVL